MTYYISVLDLGILSTLTLTLILLLSIIPLDFTTLCEIYVSNIKSTLNLINNKISVRINVKNRVLLLLLFHPKMHKSTL